MPLKLTKADLLELRADGATIRTKPKVVPIAEPAKPAEPAVDVGQIYYVVQEAVRDGFEQQPRPSAPSYRFDVKRDSNGLIQSITAHPITR